MKKLFALLLALMMIFSLAACGESKTTDSDKDSSTASRSDDGSVNRDENSTDNGGNEDDGDVGSKEACAFCFDIEGSDRKCDDCGKWVYIRSVY